MLKKSLLFSLIMLILAACRISIESGMPVSTPPTLPVSTQTLVPVSTPPAVITELCVKSPLNVRSDPDPASIKVSILDTGTRVKPIKGYKNWRNVYIASIESSGWVNVDYLKKCE